MLDPNLRPKRKLVEENARKFYDVAKSESLRRIILRDHVLIFYVGAVGTFLGFALSGNKGNFEILVVLPFLSFGAGVIVAQHNLLIGYISQYCSKEIAPYITNNGELKHWDCSDALDQYRKNSLNLRTTAHLLLLVGPPLVAMCANYKMLTVQTPVLAAIWLLGVLITCLTCWLLMLSGNSRKIIHNINYERIE